MKKICFTSLGCPRNLVDSEVMIALLQKKGMEITPDISTADFCIVNTCGFLTESRKEAYLVLKEIFESKKTNAKVIVTGCMVEKYKTDLEKDFPDISYFLGAGNAEDIIEAVESKKSGSKITKKSFLESKETPRFLSTPQNYAYLKIAEGCRKRCAYCLIPEIKGPLHSKPIEEVVREFNHLLDQGVYEVILIAQDLGDYGKDLYGKCFLAELLKEILKIKKDFRIRLLYIYPDSLTDEIVDVIGKEERIYKYVDMPIQHINDEILKKMRRSTSKKEIIQIINRLREKVPDIVIRTTIMVGFPSETEEQFSELLQFLEEYRLERVGVFKYSNEEGAAAFSFEGQVSEKVKKHREKKLYFLQQKISQNKNKGLIGKKVEVFVEAVHPDSNMLLKGRMWDMAPEIDPIVIINDYEKFNGFYKPCTVMITDVAGVDLIGKIIKGDKK